MTAQKLTYLSDEIWARLPLPDFRARFFVESYTEKLRLYTPHFYQARLTNVFSNCREALTYIHEYETSKKSLTYIRSSIDEIEDTWDSDAVARPLLRDLLELRRSVFSGARENNVSAKSLNKLKVLCRAVSSREQAYASALVSSLESAITGEHALEKKNRILSAIYDQTGLYITHLLNQGHSPTYLFNRAQMFTRENKYGGRNFVQQFRWITEKLGDHKTDFESFFSIHTNKPSALLSINDDPEFSFFSDPPAGVAAGDLEKLKRNTDPNLYAKVSLTSTDQVTAALRAKERLDNLLDVVTALELSPQIRTSGHCYVRYRSGGALHGAVVNVDTLLSFMSSEVGTYFSQSEATIRYAFRGLDALAKDQLERSLRYLRLARESVSMEQKLLNLWIALESLFERGDSAILTGILSVVPSLYAVAGLRRRVRYLRDLLVVNGVSTTEIVRAKIFPGFAFDETTTEAQVFLLLRDEQAAIDLFTSLGDKEHLKFKLLAIFEELRDNIAISARLDRSNRDVTRQLRRIYFIRNKMAHTGHHRGVRPQLATHLLDYIAICYKAIAHSVAAIKGEGLYSVSELLLASKMGADLVIANAKSDVEISRLDQVLLVPVV